MRKSFSVFMAFLSLQAFAQKNQPVISPSVFQLRDEYIVINTSSPVSTIELPVKKIVLVDNRHDLNKIGFYPVYKSAPKKIQLSESLTTWFEKQFSGSFGTQEREERELVVIVQRFWFSSVAEQKFSLFKQHLHASLHFNLELFSYASDNYYPLKRIEGNYKVVFNEHSGYSQLSDSLFSLLRTELVRIDFASKEKNPNPVSEEAMSAYLHKKVNKLPSLHSIPKGVYSSFENFIDKKTLGDTVDMIRHYDYMERNTVSCYLGVYKNGLLQSCNKDWGYYDGRDLYLNTGGGLFVRLRLWNDQFVLTDLQQIAIKSKKKLITDNTWLANSSYNIIKDYAKSYHLFYQLDFDTGKLY